MADTPEVQESVLEKVTAEHPESQAESGGIGSRWIRHPAARIVGVALIAVLAGIALGWTVNSGASEIAVLEAQVTELEARLAGTEEELAASSAERQDLASSNQELEDEVAGLQAAVPMPDYAGKTASEAEADAKSHGWSVTRSGQPSPQPERTVISQEPPAGTDMKLGAPVKLVIAEPMPAQWYEVWSQSGSGRVITPVIDLPDVESGNLRVTYDFKGTGHNALWLCNMVGGKEDLLHNEIGSFKNTSTLFLTWDGLVFDIEGSGRWTVTLEAFGVPSQ